MKISSCLEREQWLGPQSAGWQLGQAALPLARRLRAIYLRASILERAIFECSLFLLCLMRRRFSSHEYPIIHVQGKPDISRQIDKLGAKLLLFNLQRHTMQLDYRYQLS